MAKLHMADGKIVEVPQDKAKAIYNILFNNAKPQSAAQAEFCKKVSNVTLDDEKQHTGAVGQGYEVFKTKAQSIVSTDIDNKPKHVHNYKKDYLMSPITNPDYSGSIPNRVIEFNVCDCGYKKATNLLSNLPKQSP